MSAGSPHCRLNPTLGLVTSHPNGYLSGQPDSVGSEVVTSRRLAGPRDDAGSLPEVGFSDVRGIPPNSTWWPGAARR